jgi:alkanesulfonate monooxygenase SsuD/methylene tetrahydromethanopterin reductase-like flavin-dependent oxidoreductase (luciferase family)
MRIGFFDQLPCADWQSEQQRYQDILAQIALGDALDYDTVWLGELHFSRSFSILADPLMVLAAAAQRTTRIRLGTAVTLLPLHNPVKLLEQAATTDLLSNGRLEFGVGRGTAPIHYTGYNVPQEESRERFEEALDVIVQAWSHEHFSHQGKHFNVRDVSIVPRPVQKPHPPIRLAANSPDSFALAGQRSLPIFATPVINPPDKLLSYLQAYRDNLPPGVKGDRAIAFSLHVAATRAQARKECEPSLLHFFRTAAERLRPLGAGDVKGFEAFQQAVARMQRMRFEDIDQEVGVFGDPDYCVARIRELQRAFDVDEFICYFNQGGIMDPALVQQSMRLFASEVMPHCR